MRLIDSPSFIETFASVEAVEVPQGTVVLAGQTPEPRSRSSATVVADSQSTLALVASHGTSGVVVQHSGREARASLRNVRDLVGLLEGLGGHHFLLDITGLSHGVWAALIRAAWAAELPMWACYVEPAEYSFSRVPTQGTPFDLSLSISGLSPLPGFARLDASRAEPVVVPLLGFEGARFGYVLEQLEARPDHIVPFVGAPGFRVEYPLFAFVGNRRALAQSGAYQRLRYATANDPFHLFFALEHLRSEIGSERPLVLAPIGTKPHALGAVLYYLHEDAQAPGRIELVYDHPERNPRRTQGASRVLLYYLAEFQEHLTARARPTVASER